MEAFGGLIAVLIVLGIAAVIGWFNNAAANKLQMKSDWEKEMEKPGPHLGTPSKEPENKPLPFEKKGFSFGDMYNWFITAIVVLLVISLCADCSG
jgi:hypothetical protein